MWPVLSSPAANSTMSVMYIPQAAKVVAFLSLKASFGESLQRSQVCAFRALLHAIDLLGFSTFSVLGTPCA